MNSTPNADGGLPAETIELARTILDSDSTPEAAWRDLAGKIEGKLRSWYGSTDATPAYGTLQTEQDVLIELNRKKASLRFADGDRFWAWVHEVAHNKRNDARRRQARDLRLGRAAGGATDDDMDWLHRLLDPRAGTPSGDVALDETIAAERDCIRSFARVAWRQVYALRRYCGWSYQQIAERLDYDKVETVRTVFSRATNRVRSCLRDRIGDILIAAMNQ